MDCDYDPAAQFQNDLIKATKRKKGRKWKSKFAEVVAKKKPVFDSSNRTFDEYLDEYYKLDFEDLIGDLPCRFKYRKVIPNNFGLSVEEILQADDKELNKWCSLKRAVQHRPEHVETYDVQAYTKKEEDTEIPAPKKKRSKKKKRASAEGVSDIQADTGSNSENKISDEPTDENTVNEAVPKKKKSKKRKHSSTEDVSEIFADGSFDSKRAKSQVIDGKTDESLVEDDTDGHTQGKQERKKKRQKLVEESGDLDTLVGSQKETTENSATVSSGGEELLTKKKKQKKPKSDTNEEVKVYNGTGLKKIKEKNNTAKSDNTVEGEQKVVSETKQDAQSSNTQGGKKKKKKKKNKAEMPMNNKVQAMRKGEFKKHKVNKFSKNKSKNNEFQRKKYQNESEGPSISDARLRAYGINPKKYKNKLKYGNKTQW
ncbi:hypothetical protein C0J52_08100 [Blattella germanica]|nr:hypothetical protein C0J52_08100 [Blattella germanica]